VVRELRVAFHQQLQEIDHEVVQLFTLVGEDLNLATRGLLEGDPDVLKVVSEREAAIDSIYSVMEGLVNEQLALQGPVADDLRLLLSVLRVVPELERSHDLVVLIAEYATHSLEEALSPRSRGLVRQMSDTGVEMWDQAATAWQERDPVAVEVLRDRDEEMDGLHATLMAELASGAMSLPVTMDMTLVARFYERLGDHAVNIARRVEYLAGHDAGE
jgi:phosphate transport system protein